MRVRVVVWVRVVVVGLEAVADPEQVPVRMAHVHLAYAPWLVGRRPRDVEALLQTPPVHVVDVGDPEVIYNRIAMLRAERGISRRQLASR